jgi:hypothetical protein
MSRKPAAARRLTCGRAQALTARGQHQSARTSKTAENIVASTQTAMKLCCSGSACAAMQRSRHEALLRLQRSRGQCIAIPN